MSEAVALWRGNAPILSSNIGDWLINAPKDFEWNFGGSLDCSGEGEKDQWSEN